MHPFNSLTFYISGAPGRILPGHPLWDRPLSGRSGEFAPDNPVQDSLWTIGRYFTAAGDFLCLEQTLDLLTDTVRKSCGPKDPGNWDLELTLLKHGAFYHPIQITLSQKDSGFRQDFALNGAVASPGLELIYREGDLLTGLGQRLGPGVVPDVFAGGKVRAGDGGAGFLMTRWLGGFFEFHRTASRGKKEVVVWRPGEKDLFLSMEDALPLYRNIAGILTRAFDIQTGSQIFHWHHAAGDFIVNPVDPDLDVRLITVRDYGAMGGEEFPKGLPGLLLFFVNLCLRMQLDRLDGVGEPVFLGEEVLTATREGFEKGLLEHPGNTSGISMEEVRSFISSFGPEDILGIMIQMMEIWPPGPSELPLIQGKAHELAGRISRIFK